MRKGREGAGMVRGNAENQTILGFAFKARKPKRGWHLVCMKRQKVYGCVGTVRPDKTFKRTGPHGLVVDSRRTGATWESIQYDPSGEFRFMERVPPEFTPDSGR